MTNTLRHNLCCPQTCGRSSLRRCTDWWWTRASSSASTSSRPRSSWTRAPSITASQPRRRSRACATVWSAPKHSSSSTAQTRKTSCWKTFSNQVSIFYADSFFSWLKLWSISTVSLMFGVWKQEVLELINYYTCVKLLKRGISFSADYQPLRAKRQKYVAETDTCFFKLIPLSDAGKNMKVDPSQLPYLS